MRAAVITRPGGPEVLEVREVPDPSPGEGEVLLEVAATAVNRADIMQREGHYPPPPGASEYPGLEASGTILAVGPGVTGWSAGDRAMALLAGGGYAELTAVRPPTMPTTEMRPRRASARMSSSQYAAPTSSTITSAPWPSVRRRTSAARSSTSV